MVGAIDILFFEINLSGDRPSDRHECEPIKQKGPNPIQGKNQRMPFVGADQNVKERQHQEKNQCKQRKAVCGIYSPYNFHCTLSEKNFWLSFNFVFIVINPM